MLCFLNLIFKLNPNILILHSTYFDIDVEPPSCKYRAYIYYKQTISNQWRVYFMVVQDTKLSKVRNVYLF